MGWLLTLVSGLAWTLVYLAMIRIGFRQQTYAMPVAALALNFAWEWIYAVEGLVSDPTLQTWVNLAWGLADAVIVVTFVRFGRREFPASIGRGLFGVGAVGLVAVAVVVQWLFLAQFGVQQGAIYSAFLQNLLMSGLFIAMYVARGGTRGQSLTIAMAKWLGTLAPTAQLMFFLPAQRLAIGVGVLCSVLDLAYVWLVARDPLGNGAAARGQVPRVRQG